MSERRIRLLAAAGAVVAGAAASYCALWIFSSASLACTACNCNYSLFAKSFRCLQPYIALLLAVGFVATTVWMTRRARLGSRKRTA